MNPQAAEEDKRAISGFRLLETYAGAENSLVEKGITCF